MRQDKPENIITLNCEARYDYFLTTVSDTREIWILVNAENQFLKLFSEDDDFEYLPIWPSAEFALEYTKDSKEALDPKSISLPDFFKKWISGLQRDRLTVSVFPTSSDETLWMMSPSELQDDLKEELSRMG